MLLLVIALAALGGFLLGARHTRRAYTAGFTAGRDKGIELIFNHATATIEARQRNA